jgi:hypothetical protein
MTHQTSRTVLDAISNLEQRLTGLDVSLCPLTDLTMCFSGLTVIREEVAIQVVEVTFLFAGGSIAILVLVFDLFALGIGIVRE